MKYGLRGLAIGSLIFGAGALAALWPTSEESKRDERKLEERAVLIERLDASNGDNASNRDNTANDDDVELMAKMLFGEARGQSDEEKAAVAYTAINRINDGKKWNGTTLKGVILCPKQYSCFNSNDPNRRLLENPGAHDSQSYGACLRVARNVLEGRVADPTNGATHYFNPRVCQPKWASSPKMTRIGRVNGSAHEFYKED